MSSRHCENRLSTNLLTLLAFAFGLSLLVVFLVLAAQFESFVHPLTIMLTVPLAVAGAMGGVFLAGSSLNVHI
jgi:multidrug efflux pump